MSPGVVIHGDLESEVVLQTFVSLAVVDNFYRHLEAPVIAIGSYITTYIKRFTMAITSVDVDQVAIREVKKLLNMKSDREVINEGVALLLAKARQKDALRRIGKRTFTVEQISGDTIPYPL